MCRQDMLSTYLAPIESACPQWLKATVVVMVMDGLKAVPFTHFHHLGGPQVRGHSVGKNISRNGPRNCRSLGYARDDKGEAQRSHGERLLNLKPITPLKPSS